MCNVHNASSSLITYLAENKRDNVVVINNCGICLEGTSQEIFMESLQVNCLSPMHINELFISELKNKEELTIVNISSGEGELVFINSEFQERINGLENYQVKMLCFDIISIIIFICFLCFY